jgi:hypothetical protein
MTGRPPILTTASSLKPETREAIRVRRMHRRTPKASAPAEPVTLELIPFVPKTGEDLDVLIRIWALASSIGEHHRVFGDSALSPSGFVACYTQNADLMVIVQQGASWRQGDGLYALVWLDDITGPSARLNYFVLPSARTGRLVHAMLELLLHYLFEVRHLEVLIGRTPATMPLALRMIRQAGFAQTWVCPHGVKDGHTVTDAVYSMLTREMWAAQQSEEG